MHLNEEGESSCKLEPHIYAAVRCINGAPTCSVWQVKTNGPQSDAAWKLAKKAFPGEIVWNFAGIFLFDASGTPVGRYGSHELTTVGKQLAQLVEACAA